jgi:long-chain acyl-CoA synthetase
MLYSSGSTGRPKRIERTHAQLIFETDRLIKAIGLTSDDRVLGVAPFSHINGMMRSMVASLVGGATLVPLPQYERRLVAQTIEAQRITVFIGVPFMFAVLADTRWPKPVDFSSLRLCVSASAPLRPEASRRFHARYGLYVRQLYGCSETGSISVNLDADPADSLESVGKPLEGIEIDVFTEDRRILPPGEEGEIGIRSPAAINQYPDRPEENAAAFWGGCFFPGDIGRKDEDGRLYLLGRKSLFINRGGFKVNPYELEALLEKHPKVAEVAVVGIPAEHGDEKIKAVVIPSASCDEQEIVEFCRGKIADFKIPSVIEFRAELPKSSSGKVLRKQLL